MAYLCLSYEVISRLDREAAIAQSAAMSRHRWRGALPNWHPLVLGGGRAAGRAAALRMYSSSGRKRGKYTGVSSGGESDDESSQGCSINLLTEDEESTAEFSGWVDWVVATQAALVNYDQNSGDIEEEERQGLHVMSYPLLTMLSSSNTASSPSSGLSHRPSATSSSSLDTVASSPISPLPASLSNASFSPSNAFSFATSSSSMSTSPTSMLSSSTSMSSSSASMSSSSASMPRPLISCSVGVNNTSPAHPPDTVVPKVTNNGSSARSPS